MNLPQISPGACGRWRVWLRPPGFAEERWTVPVQTCVGAAPPVGETAAVVAGRRGTTCFQQPEQQRSGAYCGRTEPAGGGGPPFGPRPVSFAAQTGSQHYLQTPASLWTVGSQASVQVGVNHWAESLRSIRSTVHLTDLACCSWLGANDFSGFWCKVSLKIDDLLQWPHDAILRKWTLNPCQIFLFHWTKYFVYCKYTHLFNTVKIIDKFIRKNAVWMPLSKSR